MIAVYAAMCMVCQDVMGTLMVMAEARSRGWLAGVFDSAMWLFGIATTTISVTALQGHSTSEKVAVLVLVTAANLVGSRLGVYMGNRFVKQDDETCTCCPVHNPHHEAP